MTSERDVEAPLTPADVRKILGICSSRALLVGGQALAFWADYLGVKRPATLASGVTADADFIGDADLARELGRRLGWKTWVPSIDDATPQTGKVTQRLKTGRVKQVDFLSGVAGLTTKDLVRRAIELEIPDVGRLRVIHPIDVLDSRIQNLHLLAEKRTPAGIAQAELAVDVSRAFVRREIESRGERAALTLVERIVAIASDTAALRVHLRHKIDPLAAIPLEEFRLTTALHRTRWPQVVVKIGRQRAALAASMTRRKTRSRRG